MAAEVTAIESAAVGAGPAGPCPAGRSDRPADLAVTVIRPRRGWEVVGLRDLWRYRELAYFLCWRDVKVRYKQTVLGMLWVVLQPLLTMVVFTVFFGRLMGLQKQMESPYEIFVLAGQLPWFLFAQSLSRASESVVGSANLVTKVYFPRILIPIAATGACLVDFAVAGVILVIAMVCYGIPPSPAMLMLPLFVLLALAAALGVGMFIAALNVAYRDFRYVVPFLIQIWMFATPVIYPVKIIPEAWRWILSLNPMMGAINGCRACILPEFSFAWGRIAVSAAVALASLLIGTAYFRRVERGFADII